MKGIRPRFLSYTVAFLTVSVALLLTFIFKQLLTPTIFLLFFAAVAISSWYGGFKAGLLTTLLSAFSIDFFFLDPKFSLYVNNLDSKLRLFLFILVSTLIAWLNSELGASKQRLECANQQLQESEAKFRRLVDSNIIGVIVADLNGLVLEANDAFLRIVGYTQEDLHKRRVNWLQITPPEYLAQSDRAIATLKTTGVCHNLETEYIRKDGSRVYVIVGFALLERSDNQVVGFVLDSSERILAKQALQASEARLRKLTEKVRVIPWEVDIAQNKFTYVGPQSEEILGYPARDWYSENFWDEHIHPEDQTWVIKHCHESSLTLDNYEFEYRMLAADGRVVWLHDIINVVRSGKEPRLLHGFMIDISERKQAEQERQQLLEREKAARTTAEVANRIKDEFLATLSHELRTPLNAVLGWVQLLRSRQFDQTTTERALETIERNTRVLTQIIQDILDVSQIIRGQLRLKIQPLDLTNILKDAVETIQPAANAKEISLQYESEPNVGLVMGDGNRMQQIIWNLLANAVKFTPKGGKVTVKLRRVDSSVEIQVSDTGSGIAPEFLPHVFERFRQADSSTTRSHGGLGLGLAIVRHLVELHGGKVYATSPGLEQGATFVVNLPMRAIVEPVNNNQPELNPTDTENFDHSPILKGLRVLVVDDEPDAQKLISTILEEYGAQVMTVSSAPEALQAFPKFYPEILISDIGMPQTDGYTLIRQLRSLPQSQSSTIPAIALTAYARPEDRTKALSAGFQLHLPKPVNPDELASVVANLAGRTVDC
ncbi:histidine kinase [Nostoc sp. CENA543]|uniref:hybrid sensor histidine kinase/response regulator n=1 Tax=Nostoc sp. CENA543 TaxID=1869241 RepID=UPI000CA21359|nr:PAS domain S-box protein [Nostoc sp. CENA543]AUT00838.1 histidine kinase [Nostoc sp. CENA543]